VDAVTALAGRVLGIDPSLTATAVASSAGWVEVTGEAGKRADGYPERLARITRQYVTVRSLIGDWSEIELAVLEGPAYSRSDPSAFDRARLWWDIYGCLFSSGIPVAVVPSANRAQYAAGRGNAAKGAVIDAAARRWPQFETGGDDNAADAVTLLAMGLDWLGRPLCPMPATHRKALGKVAWPEGPRSA